MGNRRVDLRESVELIEHNWIRSTHKEVATNKFTLFKVKLKKLLYYYITTQNSLRMQNCIVKPAYCQTHNTV